MWALTAAVATTAWPAASAPFLPADDKVVLERLPVRANDPQARELRELRQQLARDPRHAETAVRLAQRYFGLTAAEGDPRYIGYAQAALAPWWNQPEPPPEVRVMRAKLRQFNHEFEAAVADLSGAARQDPSLGEAWSWLAAIALVQARYPDARAACERAAPLATPVIEVACMAAIDSITGRAATAADRLRQVLAAHPQAGADEKLWALTRLAETELRRGRTAEAEDAFRQALGLKLVDGYLLAAYADFLLDQRRPAEVLTLLKDQQRSDLLLLRLALAARDAQSPLAAAYARDLRERFAAARLRGDTTHEKEEARFVLAIDGQPRRALELAVANFRVQREPADARVLLEAAVAAREPGAAEPVLRWMADSGIESVVLASLAQRLKGGR
jgi:cytochrome c-type biogenesis protein CcmH/NrfG